MIREFHIFTSELGTHFTMNGMDEGASQDFPSLFEAVRHARNLPDSGEAIVVVHSEAGEALNRIPLHFHV